MLLHSYVKGLFSKRYEKSLYIVVLPINPLLLVPAFFLFFLVEKVKQQYPLFYYRRTSLYRLGAFGVVVLHYSLEFFFNSLWIVIKPASLLASAVRKALKVVKKALKSVGIDTEKIYRRFKYKLSEYSFF